MTWQLAVDFAFFVVDAFVKNEEKSINPSNYGQKAPVENIPEPTEWELFYLYHQQRQWRLQSTQELSDLGASGGKSPRRPWNCSVRMIRCLYFHYSPFFTLMMACPASMTPRIFPITA
jgi:hypothetical protein